MNPFLSRRHILAGGAILTGASLAGFATTRPAQAAAGDVGVTATLTDHGIVATERNVRTAAAGMRADGTPLLYLISNGNPVSFNVLNADTGELIGEFPLAPHSVGGYPDVAPDGTAYFSVRGDGNTVIHRYDPVENKVEPLVTDPTGDTVTRALRIDGNTLYGSTYPNAKTFSYDLRSGRVRDYGTAADGGDKYAWGFEKVGNTMFTGTGIGEGHAVAIRIGSGATRDLPIPARYHDTLTYFHWFRRIGHLVAMVFRPRLPDGTNCLFWDTENDDWVHQDLGMPFSLNGPITADTPDGKAYFRSGGEIYEFDSHTGAARAVGWEATGLAETGSHRTLDLVMVGQGSAARPILLGGNNDGSFWRFDVTTQEHQFFESAISGAPLSTRAVTVGPDSRVYVGTYLGPGAVGRYDPADGAMETLEGPGQVDSMLTMSDELFLGSYPNAVVHRGRPAEPWDFGTNPSEQFELIGATQDRIVDMATDGERVAIGTVADYGVSGGALTVLGTDGTPRTHRDLVERQSVISVVFGPDGLVYAGTSRYGGLSSENSTADAELLVVDPATGTVLHSEVPVVGNELIGALTVTPDGLVWGITLSGHVFSFDPVGRAITSLVNLGVRGGSGDLWGLAHNLHAHPTDGLIYGHNGQVFALDPSTGEAEFLLDRWFLQTTISPDGLLYAVSGPNLYSIAVERG